MVRRGDVTRAQVLIHLCIACSTCRANIHYICVRMHVCVVWLDRGVSTDKDISRGLYYVLLSTSIVSLLSRDPRPEIGLACVAFGNESLPLSLSR